MAKSNYEKMLAGEAHSGGDPYLFELKKKASEAKARLEEIPNEDFMGRSEASRDLFADGSGPAVVLSPFTIQYGKHVKRA